MLSFTVCLWLLTALGTGTWGQQQVFLSLGSTTITTNNTEIDIADIGEGAGRPSLMCHTDLTTCCRSGDGMAAGDWYHPDGTVVPSPANAVVSDPFYRTRNEQVARLNRRRGNNPLSPTGSYCCVVPTTGGEMVTFCANLVVCPTLTLDNGMISYSDPTLGVGSVATHTCDSGYELSGGSTRTCQSNGVMGVWSGSALTCEITGTTTPLVPCPTLAMPANGRVMYNDGSISSRPVGTVATYSCNSDYTLSSTGDSTRTCQNDGMWSGSAPTCEPAPCTDLPSLTNGMIFYDMPALNNRPVGTIATHTCNTGFALSGTSTRTCELGNTWSGAAPTCEVVCSDLTMLANGGLSYNLGSPNNRPVGTEATYSCSSGYTLNGGTNMRTCQSDGMWSGSAPSCQMTIGPTVPPACTDLPVPVNGGIGYNQGSTNNRPVSTVATYSCNNGYIGGSTRTCQSSATWDGSPASCTPVDCGPPPTIENSEKTSTGTTFDQTATYSCNPGYELSGPTTVTCRASMTWATPPTCNPVDCGPLPSIDNGSPGTPTSSTFEAEVTYNCNPGFIHDGSSVITCQAGGTWSTAICVATPPVYLSLQTTNYITANGQILISSIGESNNDALVCQTDLTTCCTGADQGEWLFPDGTTVPDTSASDNSFFSSRDTSVVRLHQRGTVDVTGSYCCMIPTSQGDSMFCVELVEELSSSTTAAPSGGTDPGVVAGVIIVVLILIVIVIVGAIVGVYLWRRLRQNQVKYSRARRTPPPRPPPFKASFKKVDGEGAVTIQTVTAPNISLFPMDTHAIEGEEVYWRVLVGGHPPPTMTWYHNGSKVVADYATELDDDGSLAFPSVEKKHEGVYKLVATGGDGTKVERELKLTVASEGEASQPEKPVDYSPVPVAQLGTFVSDLHAARNQKFKDYYTALDSGEKGHPVTISLSPENRPSNRFGNIAVYDDNRIVLQPITGRDDCQSEYINACYVDGYKKPNKFLATQGPLPRTLVDFWRLIWQERPPIIVMLTNLKEGNKIKCQPYWPESGKKSFGPFTVTITDQQVLADYTVRTLEASLTGDKKTLKVKLFHFTAWPDHGVPEYATPILGFHRRVKSQHNPSKGPLLVHCSAGVGRTGTYIVIDNVLDQIDAEGIVDISGAIVKARNQRMKLVQTQDQYVFIHDAILESVTCGDTQVNAGDLRRQIQKISREAPGKSITGFEYQFQILEQVTPNPKEARSPVGVKYSGRNRNMDYLPPEQSRVILKGEQPDYIHAVFAHGYKHQKAYIIAQNPLPSTVRNFWKVIYDRKCAAVVMLTPLKEDGQEVCSQYWPEDGQVTGFGEYTVDNLGEESNPGFTMRQLSVLNEKTKQAHQVTQFHITNWRSDGSCDNLKTVTDINEEVTKVQRRTGNNPIMVHCYDTATRSGMYCSIATTIDRCKTEGVVDVFQVVKALRVHKPGAVPSVDNYKAVFEALLVFLESFDNYANFQDI